MDNNFIKHAKYNDIVDFVKKAVMSYYDVDESVFKKGSRNKNSSLIKRQTIYLICEISDVTPTYLAKLFGYRNHSSISEVITSLNDRISWDKKLSQDVAKLLNILKIETLSEDVFLENNKKYFVNMNNFTSVTSNPNRAIIYIGYSDKEIYELSPQDEPVEIRKHTNTYKFILEKK